MTLSLNQRPLCSFNTEAKPNSPRIAPSQDLHHHHYYPHPYPPPPPPQSTPPPLPTSPSPLDILASQSQTHPPPSPRLASNLCRPSTETCLLVHLVKSRTLRTHSADTRRLAATASQSPAAAKVLRQTAASSACWLSGVKSKAAREVRRESVVYLQTDTLGGWSCICPGGG